MSSLFDKNLFVEQESSEDFSELLPLADICSDANINFEKGAEKNKESFNDIILENNKLSPLDSLKNDMLKNTHPIKKESLGQDSPSLSISTKSSLLEKCLPFIYDDDGEICIEDKPDYTLESVDDIINSAERRAKEKIAKLYNLSYDKKRGELVESSADIKMAPETPKPSDSDKFETKVIEIDQKVELPTKSDILLDDLSGKRTVLTSTESITTTYSELNNIQNRKHVAEEKTQVLPDIKPQEIIKDEFEDIISHTRQINVKDIPSINNTSVSKKTAKNKSFSIDTVVEDYFSFSDAKKIGTKLKKQRRSAFLRLSFTSIITLAVLVFSLPFFDLFLSNNSLVASAVALGLFSLTALLNLNIFKSFKYAFSNKMSVDFITALCVCSTELHLIFSLILGSYHFKSIIPALISLVFSGYFKYCKATMVLNNFKLIAARKEKHAIALIDDAKITSLMARSSIEGDVLAAGLKRTAEITDFLKHTSYDKYSGQHLSILSAIIIGVSFVVSLFIGITYSSLDSALYGLAIILSLFAMPSLIGSEYLPITNMASKLFKMKAAVFGKYSASKIEQINAAVINSSDLFPKGSIELANIHPLGASSIDEILRQATAIASIIKSPLEFVFKEIVGENADIPVADSVKYEDNLGISGWVGDNNFHIGNRTLMEAHNIKVPSLEVDKKILHKGFFPVYIACDQRACALLIVKYKPVEQIESSLLKLINTGVTLLINNCDPNITEDMLTDYYSLYPDSIKIMDHIGCAKYKGAVNYSETTSTHAFTNGDILSFLNVLISSIKLRTASNVMFTIYIITALISAAVFTLVSLSGSLNIMSVGLCLSIEAICFIISLLGYFFSS